MRENTLVWSSQQDLAKLLDKVTKRRKLDLIISHNISDLTFIKRLLLRGYTQESILNYIDSRISELKELKEII